MVGSFFPRTLNEALAIRKAEPVIPYAGGTDLMVRRRSWAGTLPRFEAPPLFIGRLRELREIHRGGGMLTVGAAVTLAELLEQEDVPGILKQAIAEMASPAIRNVATIGGNLCNASPAGDSLPPLYVLGAAIVLQSVSGQRELPIPDFIKGPGRTALGPDELLIGVKIPAREFPSVFYKKVGTRKADALSKLSCAGLARISNGRVEEARLALGAVAPTVIRLETAEARLTGVRTDELVRVLPEILKLYDEAIRPIDDQRSSAAYRRKVALRLIEVFVTGLV
jgi:xanthine dehydrogenase FAD-binding subunit